MSLGFLLIVTTPSKTLQFGNVVGGVEKTGEPEVQSVSPGSGQHNGDVVGRLIEVHVEAGECVQVAQIWAVCQVITMSNFK